MGCDQGKARLSQEVLAETSQGRAQTNKVQDGAGRLESSRRSDPPILPVKIQDLWHPGDVASLQTHCLDPTGQSQQPPLGVALLRQKEGPDTKRRT